MAISPIDGSKIIARLLEQVISCNYGKIQLLVGERRSTTKKCRCDAVPFYFTSNTFGKINQQLIIECKLLYKVYQLIAGLDIKPVSNLKLSALIDDDSSEL